MSRVASGARHKCLCFAAVFAAAPLFPPLVTRAADSAWTLDGDGNWSNPANWSAGVPNAVGDNASFVGVITHPRTINQDVANLKVGSIFFNNTNRFTITGNNIILDETLGNPVLGVTSGDHTIESNIQLNDVPVISGNPNTTLTLSGIIFGTAPGLIKFNGGLTLSGVQSNIYNGDTRCDAGVLHLAKTAGVAIPGGTLTVGHVGTTTTSTATLVLDHGGNLATSVAVVVEDGSTIDGNGQFTVIGGGLTLTGATIINADLRVNSDITVHGPSFYPTTIDGSLGGTRGLDLFGGVRGFTVESGSFDPALTVSAPVYNGGVFKHGPGRMVLSSSNNTYAGATSVDAGILEFRSSITTSSDFSVYNDGRIVLAENGTRVIKARTVSIIPSGGSTPQMDLRDNKLIVTQQPVGTWDGMNYTDISGSIASGRNGGGWGGSGIVTSMNDAITGNYTSLGIATAAQAKGTSSTQTSVWAGRTVFGTDTLVMYTYGGDANLDGKINVDDYGHIDSSIPVGLKGWFNGDFNYDGKINVDDYGIIDFNIGIQGAPFPTSSGADLNSIVAVPEPLSFAPAVIACMLLPRRGNRRAQINCELDKSLIVS